MAQAETDVPIPERAVFRFVRVRCPLCGHTSPVTDQTSDVRRELLSRWWQKHKESAHPYPSPIFEVATPTEAETSLRGAGKDVS